jgi:DNA-binding MarR family transcriptional regulator
MSPPKGQSHVPDALLSIALACQVRRELFPPVKAIAHVLKVSTDTIYRHLNALHDAGTIDMQNAGHNRRRVRVIQDAGK